MVSVQPSSSVSHAIYWWHTCLAQAPRRQAETVRNGLLQDLFALQRLLELSCRAQQALTPEQLQDSLDHLTRLQTAMTHLSDELSPPQSDDLATAIQQQLHRWQEQHWRLGNPAAYKSQIETVTGNPELNEIILLVFEEWLRIIETVAPIQLQISLAQHQAQGQSRPGQPESDPPEEIELALTLTLSEQSPLLSEAALSELRYLQQIFYLLTQGEYCQWLPQTAQERVLQGRFCWKAIVPEKLAPETIALEKIAP